MIHQNFCSIFYTIILFLNLIVLGGCSNQDDNASPKDTSDPTPIQGGIYRVPLANNPTTLDPAYVQDPYGAAVVNQIFDGLVRFDRQLSIMPAIAETWKISDNGKLYQFTLKENIYFHNMDPVTNEDVVFSIKRLLKTKHVPAILPHLMKIKGAEAYRLGNDKDIAGLKTENKKTLFIRLIEPYAPFLTALGIHEAAIVPQKEVERLGKDFGKHPVGVGPFKFISWEKNNSIVLKRFNEYYTELAHLDEIQYKIYSKGQNSLELTDFQQNKIDEMAVYGDCKEKLADKKKLQWFHRPSLNLFFYGINIKHPILSDKNFRNALSMAIDREKFVSQVYKGQYEIATTILPPGIPGFSPSNKIKDKNLELALELIKKSTINPNETPFELEIVSSFKTTRVEQEIELMKKFWAPLNLSIKAKYITDWKNFVSYLNSEAVQIYRGTWFADMPDPDSFLYSLFASGSPTNFTKLEDKNINQMLSKARGITDPIERADFYQKIEAGILDLAPVIPLFYMNVDRVYQPYVKNINVSALGAHTMPLNKIWLDKPQTGKLYK